MSASHPSDSEEIRQQVRSREGHSVAAYKDRIRRYRKALRESTRAIEMWHKLAKQYSEENARMRDYRGMAPHAAFDDKEAHRKWREDRTALALRQFKHERDVICPPCSRLHFDISILAYTLLLLTCGVAGYLLGILHHVR